ncbi:alpha/beta fold hydrolase [Marinobacter lacisalsi]|uniref:Alpha/beta fold hydrolase n=1 Tax=Marinobacter lacisalsi TaxID=475979 RepID=A0ABV8QJM1_9GAMM
MNKVHLGWPVVLLIIVLLAACSRHDVYHWIIDYERGQAGLESSELRVGDLSVAYLSNSVEEPERVLLMVHGFGGNKDNWVRMAPYLPEDYRLLIPDLAGHGDSSVGSSDDYTVEAQAATLAAFLDKLGVQRVDMAGNSMGGGITVYFASRYPDRVRTIALYDPAGSTRYPSELDEALARGENPLVVEEPGDMDDLMDFVLEKRPFMPWPLASVMEEKAMAREEVNEAIFEAIRSSGEIMSLESVLSSVEAPALIVWGRQDRVLAPENAEVFAEGIQTSRVVLLDGVGHVPMLEVPERSANLWHDFLQQHPVQ